MSYLRIRLRFILKLTSKLATLMAAFSSRLKCLNFSVVLAAYKSDFSWKYLSKSICGASFLKYMHSSNSGENEFEATSARAALRHMFMYVKLIPEKTLALKT